MKYGGAYMLVNVLMKNTIVRKMGKKRYSLFGLTTFETNGDVLIEISEKKNPTIDLFAITLLHEMLHVWLEILKRNGATIDLRKDHKFIAAVENSICDLAKLLKGNQNEKEK
jgi:hypothetical protein